jgi:hypothetical protein
MMTMAVASSSGIIYGPCPAVVMLKDALSDKEQVQIRPIVLLAL